jgi:lysozyme family protein
VALQRGQSWFTPTRYGLGRATYFGRTAAEESLQRALNVLADNEKDESIRVGVDGKVGPLTTAAVNRALVKYADSAYAWLKTGKLTVADVKNKLAPITQAITGAAAGAAPAAAPPPSTVAVASGTDAKEAAKKLQRALNTKGFKLTVDGVVGPQTTAAVNGLLGIKLTAAQIREQAATLTARVESTAAAGNKETVKQMQRALSLLGFETGDQSLVVKDDGVVGPLTTAAVNRAMSQVAEAPSNLRTGKLTAAQVMGNLASITIVLQNEIEARRVATAKEEAEVVAQEVPPRDEAPPPAEMPPDTAPPGEEGDVPSYEERGPPQATPPTVTPPYVEPPPTQQVPPMPTYADDPQSYETPATYVPPGAQPPSWQYQTPPTPDLPQYTPPEYLTPQPQYIPPQQLPPPPPPPSSGPPPVVPDPSSPPVKKGISVTTIALIGGGAVGLGLLAFFMFRTPPRGRALSGAPQKRRRRRKAA